MVKPHVFLFVEDVLLYHTEVRDLIPQVLGVSLAASPQLSKGIESAKRAALSPYSNLGKPQRSTYLENSL